MLAEDLQKYIYQDMRKDVYLTEIKLQLPFYFVNGDPAPLCLTWDSRGILNDGGRTMNELKKRVGNTDPYKKKIRHILNSRGPVELVGGHQLVVRQFQTVTGPEGTYVDYRAAVSHMLRAISLISIVDTVSVSEDGEVSV